MKSCPACNNTFEDAVSFCPRDGEVLQESPENLVGSVLDGKYEVEGFIAQGGMGAVYRARHILLGDRVVIKMLRPEMRQNAEWLRRFQREGRAARSFRHPNAVTVYDLSSASDGHIYMVMEYVEGHTLDRELKQRGRLTPLEALDVLEPVADALDAAHARGVVHRDMKPDNVMLGAGDDGERVVKLLDLGIAKMIGVADAAAGDATTLTVAGQILGTPYYMSPEQWGEPTRDGKEEIDGRTDIYSLGIIFYELVAGRKPHNGRTLSELRQQHVRAEAPDLGELAEDVPEEFARAVARAMSKDRADRQQTAGELIEELRAALGLPARARARNTRGDIHATADAAREGSATRQTPQASEETTTRLRPPTDAAMASSHAKTILTSDFEASAAEREQGKEADARRTSAHGQRPVTSGNVAARGDSSRDTTSARPGFETVAGGGAASSGEQVARGARVVGGQQARGQTVAADAPRQRRPSVPLVAGVVLALALVTVAGGWLAWSRFNPNTNANNANANANAVGKGEDKTEPARVESVSYWIEAYDVPKAGDVQRVAETSAPLKSGQHFKFHFTPRERGYLYIVGPGEGGNAVMTFLTAQGGGLLKTNQVAAGADFAFPYGEGKVLILDENPGTEEYTFIFSPTPLLAPAFLAEKNLKQLKPAEVKALEDFRAEHKTAAATLAVKDGDGGRRVAVSVPESAAGRPVIFDVRIDHR